MATYESRKYAIIPINATQIGDGSVDNTEFQAGPGDIAARLQKAGDTMTGNLVFGDNIEARFGAGNDLKIFHDSNDSIIEDAGTGALEIRSSILNMRNAADTQDMFKATEGAAVELYHNNTKRAETTSSGFTVTGNILGDPISGQTSSGSASSSDEILAKIGGNMRRITIANAALQGPAGSPGSNGGTGPPGPPGPSGSVTSSTTAVGALRMFVHPTNVSGGSNRVDTPHVAGSSYSGSVLANYTYSNSGFSNYNVQVSGSAIGTGTWLCLGPSGRFRRTSGGDTFNARWPGLFLRTS
tara:strand:- start:524 stop:1417 length:894 start_codon:yes stop_codon:yes gene_type:complete